MSLSRYFLNIEDRVPARWLAVLERGAIVNGAQAGVNTVTVHSPHEFATDDKFIYAETRTNLQSHTSRVFTVSSATETTVTFSGATFSFPDKALLVNLGADTGGVQQNDGTYSKLNYDAAAVTIYKEPQGVAAWSESKAAVDPGGECGFWGSGQTVWAVAINSQGIGIRAYPDIGSAGATAPRVAALPSAGGAGQLVLLGGSAGVPDTLYCWMKFSDDTYDWLEVGRAS